MWDAILASAGMSLDVGAKKFENNMISSIKKQKLLYPGITKKTRNSLGIVPYWGGGYE
jgi:hypothetical protein